jgi:ubiquinone/menaquinone biosynthesis C-methylase UbiE
MVQYEDYSLNFIELEKYAIFDGAGIFIKESEITGVVVDIGCGYGSYLAEFGGEWDQFIGIEPNPLFRKVARKLAKKLGFDCTFIEGVAENLPLEDNFADTIITTYAFADLESPKEIRQGLSEIYRVAKPGARVIFVNLTGGVEDNLAQLYRVAEVCQGEEPWSIEADLWIEALKAFSSWGSIRRFERTQEIYSFPNPEEALHHLSSLTPDLKTNQELREKVKEIFTLERFVGEALCVEVVLDKKQNDG